MAWNEEKALEAALSFQRGEQKGFTFFFNELYYQLKYYAFKIVKDNPTAEDAVENSFIKIWECNETFFHPKVISAWLYTTVRNDCLNKLQTNKIKNELKRDLSDISPIITDGVDSNLIKAEVYAELYQYIDELPSACRIIFKAVFLEGLSVRDICTKLNLKPSTVKNQKARGLLLLRKKYNVSKELVEAKEYRWLKSVFYDSRSIRSRAKLYGMHDNCIALVRNGTLFPKITNQFL